jgi:hypothetical protein
MSGLKSGPISGATAKAKTEATTKVLHQVRWWFTHFSDGETVAKMGHPVLFLSFKFKGVTPRQT